MGKNEDIIEDNKSFTYEIICLQSNNLMSKTLIINYECIDYIDKLQ